MTSGEFCGFHFHIQESRLPRRQGENHENIPVHGTSGNHLRHGLPAKAAGYPAKKQVRACHDHIGQRAGSPGCCEESC